MDRKKTSRAEPVVTKFGKYLLTQRSKKKLSLRQLADLSDVPFVRLHRMEHHLVQPSRSETDHIARALGKKPASFINAVKRQKA